MYRGAIWKGVLCIFIVVMFLVPANLSDVVREDGTYIEKNVKSKLKHIFYARETKEIVMSTMTMIQENLAPNPSFEDGDGETPDGWEHETYHKHIEYLWTEDYSCEGKKSVGISNLRKGNLAEWYTTEFIEIDPTQNDYVYGCWYKYNAKPAGYNFAGLGVTTYDAEKEYVGVTWILPMPYLDKEWHYYQYNCNSYFDETHYSEIAYASIGLYYWTFKDAVNPLAEVYFDDVYFGAVEEKPDIKIKKITGGIGVSVTIENAGNGDASNVGWLIEVVDVQGMLLMGNRSYGTIDLLPAGDEIVVKSNFILGFGSAKILVVVRDERKALPCFILGPIVFMME